VNLLEKQLSTVYFKDARFPWVILYNSVSWWWALWCSKHVERLN